MVCLACAGVGAVAGGPLAAGLGAAAVAAPAVTSALAVASIGRQPVKVMMAVALAAPCVRLLTSVILAAAVWLAASRAGGGGALDELSFWGAFMLAALGTLVVETLSFAADFGALTVTDAVKTEAATA